MTLNGDTTANYDFGSIFNNSANTVSAANTVASTSMSLGGTSAASAPAGVFTLGEIRIADFNGANPKTIDTKMATKFGTTTSTLTTAIESAWYRGTAPITSGSFFLAAGNFVNGSILSFYARR